jgi:hypothetical protein
MVARKVSKEVRQAGVEGRTVLKEKRFEGR